MSIISLNSDYLQPLEINKLSTNEKGNIEALIDAGQEFLEENLGRKLLSASYNELHDGDGRDYLIIKNPPITVLTSIILLGITSDNDTTVSADNFAFVSKTGQIRWRTHNVPDPANTTVGKYFPKGFQNIQINYTGGFSPGSQSIKPLEKLLAEMVIEVYDPSALPQGIESERLGKYWYTRGKGTFDKLLWKNKHIKFMYHRPFV